MKKAVKIVGFFVVGAVVGLAIGLVLAKVLGGGGSAVSGGSVLRAVAIGLAVTVGAVVAYVVHAIAHEAGHLLAGLLTGYRFVSFRIFNWTLIRRDGRLVWRKFALSGTGGQCLMAPPDKPASQVNTLWYNMGGVLANALLATLAVVLCFATSLPAVVKAVLMITAVVGYAMALMNGIPLHFSGISNDGYNLLFLDRSPRDKQLLCNLLQANALMQEGTQPDQLPAAMFNDDAPVDWSDVIQANWQAVVVTRMMAQHRWDDALQRINQGLAEPKLLPLLSTELQLEKVYILLQMGRIDEARNLYSNDLQDYVAKFKRTQSSKQRIHFAATLLLDNRPDDALTILNTLQSNRDTYISTGEVTMDLALMTHLLNSRDSSLFLHLRS